MANCVNHASGKLFHAISRDKTHVLICQIAHACTRTHVHTHTCTHTNHACTCTHKYKDTQPQTTHAHTWAYTCTHTHIHTHTHVHTHTILLNTLVANLKQTNGQNIVTSLPCSLRIIVLISFSFWFFFFPNIYFQGQRQGDALDRGGKEKRSRGNKVADPPGS